MYRIFIFVCLVARIKGPLLPPSMYFFLHSWSIGIAQLFDLRQSTYQILFSSLPMVVQYTHLLHSFVILMVSRVRALIPHS
jgi:hypothetical protein